MNIKGKLIEKYDTNKVSEKFSKREFVVEYAENPQYPEFIKMELVNDKTAILDGFNVGDNVDVSINISGRKWTNPKGEVVYFNTIKAWKITKESAASTGESVEKPVSNDEADNLPF